jgi:hypothetical protein
MSIAERPSHRGTPAPGAGGNETTVYSLSPPLQPFSARRFISILSSSRPETGSVPAQWCGNGPQQSARLVMLSPLAVVSGIAAYVDFARTADERWIIGGTVILASWPYVYFVVVPVNIWLCAIPAAAARSATRELMRDWGLLEWGQTAIGLGACCVFAWALALPA